MWRSACTSHAAVGCTTLCSSMLLISRPSITRRAHSMSRLTAAASCSSSSSGGFTVPLFGQRRWQFAASQTDFYSILGVKPTASQDEIKAAYKKLALEFHPDRNKSPGAEDQFKKISEAYSVIGNKTKRKDYDASRNYGSAGWGSATGSGSGPASGPRSYGSNFGQQYTSDPFQQHAGGRVQYQQMSKDEAEKLFRDLFGGMQVDQIFRDFERQMGGGSPRNPFAGQRGTMNDFQSGHTFRPFFREDASKVFTDEYGNKTESRTFTTSNGNRFTVHNTSSKQEGASMNHSAEEMYRSGTRDDGRFHSGTQSFRTRTYNKDFGKQFFGVATHGRHPLVSLGILMAWSVIIFTIIFAVLNFAVMHPMFLGALIALYFLRRLR